jgi:sec-independent protein translocase protein TatA
MSFIASFMNLAGPDLIIILLIILVLFGAKKLPELARGMGQAVKEFQKAKDEFNDELHKADPSTAKTTTPAQALPQNPTAPAPATTHPDPNQSIPPGDQTKPV